MASIILPVSSPAPTSQASMSKRRRASRACLACRARKVRCDVVLCGKPCTNCRLDFSECVVQLRRKNRCRNIVVPSNNRPLSVKVVENDQDNPTDPVQISTPVKSSAAPWVSPPADEAPKSTSTDSIAPLEWGNVLPPDLPLATTIAPTQSLTSLSDIVANEAVSCMPALTNYASPERGSSGDNDLPDNGDSSYNLDNNLADFEMLIVNSIEDDEYDKNNSPGDTTQVVEHEIIHKKSQKDDTVATHLLGPKTDSSATCSSASNVTTLFTETDTSGFGVADPEGCDSSEAWQSMHFPFSSSLFTTTNADILSMPFSAAVDCIPPWPINSSHFLTGKGTATLKGGLAHTPSSASRRYIRANQWSRETTPRSRTSFSKTWSEPKISKNAPTTTADGAKSATHNFVIFSRYSFLSSSLLWKLDHEDDAMLLEQRGCLHVPKKPVLDDIMKQYFLNVHPILPLLNELDFWTMYNSPTPLSAPFYQTSLFLFQSMLFFVCPFVSQSTLAKLNFSSVPEARASFYRRAKMLFHLEEGRDDVSTAQGALLLTYQSSSIKDRTNSYWLNVAIHFARSANAHRYFDLPSNQARQRTVLKRLWWCCVWRDKVVSLGLRRPTHIHPADFDVTRSGLDEQDTCEEFTSSIVFTPASKRAISHVFARLCELAGILTGMLDICYPASGESLHVGKASMAQEYVVKLDAWYERSAAQFKDSIERAENEEFLSLFTNAAYIYY